MDGWMDGRANERTDGRMDGWMDVRTLGLTKAKEGDRARELCIVILSRSASE